MAKPVVKSPRAITRRVCVACQADYGVDGPLPFACDQHVTADGLVTTCSKRCREQMGYAERKAVV